MKIFFKRSGKLVIINNNNTELHYYSVIYTFICFFTWGVMTQNPT